MFPGVSTIGAIVSVDWDMERSYECRRARNVYSPCSFPKTQAAGVKGTFTPADTNSLIN